MFYDTETKHANGCTVKFSEYWAQIGPKDGDPADLSSFRCKSLTIRVDIAPGV